MSSGSSSQKQKQQKMRGNGAGCQDCGNKAKRDCAHKRCRTCCKSRGLPCPTHVRSTWIPAARRRLLHHRLSLSSSPFPRPLRLLTSGLQETMKPNFPAEVTAVANFRSVRVSSDDNAVDQAAYQTCVSIGGHFFKGILYDKGPSFSSLETSSTQIRNHQFADGGASTSAAGFAPPLLYAAGMQFFPQPKP